MSLAFVDTETLGLDPHRHAIWEIAIIIDGREHCWQVRLSDAEIEAGDPIGMEIGRFAERYETGWMVDPLTTANMVEQLLAGRHIVGAVPSFDEQRLALLCDRMLRGGHPPTGPRPWHYHLIDTEALMVGALAQAGVPIELPWKSHDLSAALAIDMPVEDEHTALGDARWAKRCWEAVMGA